MESSFQYIDNKYWPCSLELRWPSPLLWSCHLYGKIFGDNSFTLCNWLRISSGDYHQRAAFPPVALGKTTTHCNELYKTNSFGFLGFSTQVRHWFRLNGNTHIHRCVTNFSSKCCFRVNPQCRSRNQGISWALAGSCLLHSPHISQTCHRNEKCEGEFMIGMVTVNSYRTQVYLGSDLSVQVSLTFVPKLELIQVMPPLNWFLLEKII